MSVYVAMIIPREGFPYIYGVYASYDDASLATDLVGDRGDTVRIVCCEVGSTANNGDWCPRSAG